MSLTLRGLCISVLACQAGAAMAINLNFLRNAPISRFNQQDIQLLQEAFLKAMDSGADGTTVEWANDRTGASGTITPTERFQRGGAECRTARFTTRFRALTGGGEFSFCKNSKGDWLLVQ